MRTFLPANTASADFVYVLLNVRQVNSLLYELMIFSH